MERGGSKTEGDGENEQGLYFKIEIMKAYESDIQEFMWLSDGSLNELKQLKKLSVSNYYNLMKYVVDKNKEAEKRHKTQS